MATVTHKTVTDFLAANDVDHDPRHPMQFGCTIASPCDDTAVYVFLSRHGWGGDASCGNPQHMAEVEAEVAARYPDTP